MSFSVRETWTTNSSVFQPPALVQEPCPKSKEKRRMILGPDEEATYYGNCTFTCLKGSFEIDSPKL